MVLIFSEAQTKGLIDMPRALRVVEKIFHDRAAGKVRSVARLRLKGSNKKLNMMAAWQEAWDLICLRTYSSGANTISIYSGNTGSLKAIINARYLSALRTGAASGVASKYLAPANSEILGLIGTGRQAAFQLEAIVPSCGIKQVMVFGRDPKRRKNFIRTMKRVLSVDFKAAQSIDQIEQNSDILVIATNTTAPVTHGGRIKKEVLIVSMGANQQVKHEVAGKLIKQMDLIVTDDLPTAQSDSGDLISACKKGLIRWQDVFPLEKIVAKGRPSKRPKRILFQSNGLADEDLAVGRYVLERAKREKVKGRGVSEI
jgi:ornithine cyclodeaminase/alanine dehydrogenase-like protein (mu-crystallin family)